MPATGDIVLTGPLPRSPAHDAPADGPGARSMLAQWALWGKVASEPGYRVLRCSEGAFGAKDFAGVISRYTSGTKETLPQYTICWIPGDSGREGYIAVGIHELADPDPRRSGGRVRTARGREIEYIRLFCVRYAELAEHGTSYTELVEAVRDQQLPDGPTAPIRVTPPESEGALVAAQTDPLAVNVATLLLTNRPVCVLGAERTTAEERLRFIDEVTALLPYGLRTTLSASTWASATATELKLRLFFAGARREGGGEASYVTWGQPVRLELPAPENLPVRHYVSWLRHAGAGAAPELADQTAPVRFNPDEIRQMVANLPRDRPVKDVLEELGEALRRGDTPVIRAAVTRLKRHPGGTPDIAVRQEYLTAINRLGLLKDHRGLHPQTKASVYRALLRLVYADTLSYASYCEIEDCAGTQPHGTLRQVMQQLKFREFLPWLLTVTADDQFTSDELMTSAAKQGIRATVPVAEVQLNVTRTRLAHRAIAYDFAVRYLRAYAEDPRAELARRGYLADTLESVFPRDPRSQRICLEDTLRFVWAGRPTPAQVSDLYAQPGLRRTAALEAAVARLSAPPPQRTLRTRVSTPLARARNLGRNRARSRARYRRVEFNAAVFVLGTIVIMVIVILVLIVVLLQHLHR